jgi:hypothetical protein
LKDAGFASDARDRFAAVAGFALDSALAPSQAQQADDLFSFRHAQLVHGGAFAPGTSEPNGCLPVAGFQLPSARDKPARNKE